MALVHTEGFGWTTSSSVTFNRYRGVSAYPSPLFQGYSTNEGRNGGNAPYFYASTAHYLAVPIPNGSDTAIVGVAVKLENLPGSEQPLLLLGEQFPTALHVRLYLDNSGTLRVKRGDGTVLVTSSTTVTTQTWYYIELKAVINDTTGSVELRINGSNVGSASGIDTRNGGTAGIPDFCLIGQGQFYFWIDDWYICDGTGTKNNDFLGDVTVQYIRPSTDSTPLNFTTSSGTDHAALVNEDNYSASNYILGSTPGDRDQFNYSDLAVTPLTIHGVNLVNAATSTGTETRGIKGYVVSSGSENLDSNTAVTLGNLTITSHIVENDPNGDIAWTESTVNSMQAGVEVT